MPRGNGPQSKILHEGFVIFVEDIASVDKWKLDRSIPLTEVVGNFKIYNTHGHGAQNVQDEASEKALEEKLLTSDKTQCIIKILEDGEAQVTETGGRQGPKNDSMGAGPAH